MLENYKVYNVDVFDIKWEGTEYYPIKLPTHIENFEISIPIDRDENCMLHWIFGNLIEMYDIDDNYTLTIAQAKIKVNSMYYFSKIRN